MVQVFSIYKKETFYCKKQNLPSQVLEFFLKFIARILDKSLTQLLNFTIPHA